MNQEYNRIYETVRTTVSESLVCCTTRAQSAAFFAQSDYSLVAFAMIDGKDYQRQIWKRVEYLVKGEHRFQTEEGQ